jgi:hypothetical protein
MGHFHIQRKRNKKNYKIIQGHANKNSIQNTKHNAKHSETTSTNRQLQQKWLLPNDYPLKDIGQTDRAFHTRYKEHTEEIRNNNSNSEYSNHILNTGHKYVTITDTMDIIRIYRKGKHLNTLEKYHTYKISKNNLQMNDTNIDTHNPIFRVLEEMNTS